MISSSIRMDELKQEVELFVLVPSNTNITDFIYRISVAKNELIQEVYNESPTLNVQSTSQYKQLPKTLKLIFHFEAKQFITISVLHRSTMTAYGVSAPVSLNMICSLRRELNIIPIKSGQSPVCSFGIHSTITSSKSYETTVAITTYNMGKRVVSCFCSNTQPIQYYFIIHQRINNASITLGRSKSAKARQNQFQDMKLITSNEEEIRQIVVTFYEQSTQQIIGREVQINLAQYKHNKQYFLNGKNVGDGYFRLEITSNQKRYNFLQFYQSGMELALVVAIDFTQSNHHYKQQKSLHYHTDNLKSIYQQVLLRVCPVLLDFDSNKKVPVYGFGAIQAGKQKTSHYFPLAKHEQNYEVYQTQGIINIYKEVMPTLTFHGPSYFAPLLQQNVKECYKMKDKRQQYKILLILTDGDIYDYEKTIDLIVQCSQLPISIIIVGISKDLNEKWVLMQKLNNDNLELKDRQGRRATRDMVTFVPYFQSIQTPGLFESILLKELPRQISQYHRLVKIVPSDYTINRVGMDAVNASMRDIQKMKDRIGVMREINPEQIKPEYENNQEQSMLKLPEKSNLKTKLRVKQFYQERQE